MFYPYLVSKWIYLKYFEIFQMAATWGFGCVSKLEVVTEVESNTKIGHAIPYMLSICLTF